MTDSGFAIIHLDMAKQVLTIWCDIRGQERAVELLRQAVGPHRLVVVDRSGGNDGTALLQEADVALGQPDAQAALQASRLRWVQVTSAGYTRYDRDDVRQAFRQRGAMLTNSSSVFGEPCAEHLLAMMLALARQLPHYLDLQRNDRNWKAPRPTPPALLDGQTALLVGFGAIGKRMAQLLGPLNMRLIAVRHSVRGDESIETVAEERIDEVLPLADHIVNSLPDSPSTQGFFSAERLARMKKGARFYNVGRGTTVDQSALRANLESGHLDAAYLDVTTPEPLPAEDPLWTTPRCFITPHMAGSHANAWDRLARHFLENLRRFDNGEELRDRVI